MGVSFSDVKESLTTIRQRLVDIRDEVEWLEKYIAELEAAQHGVQADEGYCAENCIDDPNKIGWVFCPYCGKRLRR